MPPRLITPSQLSLFSISPVIEAWWEELQAQKLFADGLRHEQVLLTPLALHIWRAQRRGELLGCTLHVFTALTQLQHLLGERLTHRFLGALEQGFTGAIQHLAAQRAELGEQISAGLLQKLGLAFLAAQLLNHLRHRCCERFFLTAQLIHRCQCGLMACLEGIPLLAHSLQLRATHRRLFARLLNLLLCRAELRTLRFQLLAELRQALVGLQQALFQQPDLAGAITASAAAKHPAEDEAGNHAGDEQKVGAKAQRLVPSGWIQVLVLASLS